MTIVGVDVGKNSVKFASIYGVEHFPSILFPYREMNLTNQLGKHEYVVEYKGEKYFAGYLGENQGQLPLFNSDLSKFHKETLIVLLTTLWHLKQHVYGVVMGSPVSMHTEDEKKRIKSKFEGWHKITVNGIEREFMIKDLHIAPEGAGAFWTTPRMGKVRILDFGSTTVNYSTLLDKKYIDKDSGTFPYGDKVIRNDVTEIAKSVVANLKGNWNRNDYVMVIGGAGPTAYPVVREYFPYAELLPNYLTANAEGFYRIGSVIYD